MGFLRIRDRIEWLIPRMDLLLLIKQIVCHVATKTKNAIGGENGLLSRIP